MTPHERELLARIVRGNAGDSADPDAHATVLDPERPGLGADQRQMMASVLRREVPDYGLGPMTERTQRGLPNPEARSYEPTPGENAGLMTRQAIGGTTGERVEPMVRALLDYGPEPAKAYVGQFNKATDSVRDAMIDPSVSNVASAGFQTGAAVGSPLLAGGSAALGFTGALTRDAMAALVRGAEAQTKGKKPLPAPGSEEEYRDAEDRLARNAFRSADERRALRDTVQRYRDRLGKDADSQRNAEEERQRGERAAYVGRVDEAKAARDAELAKEGSLFKDTEFGKFYNKLGGAAPLAAAMGAGALYRFGKGPAANGEFLQPWKYGAGAAFTTATAPSFHEWSNAPAENPRKRAMQEYGRLLPEGHEDKSGAQRMGGPESEGGLPTANPQRETAWNEMMGPENIGKRLLFSGVEGMMAPLATLAAGGPTRIGRDIAEKGLFGSKERAVRGAIAPVQPPPSPIGSAPAGTPMPPGGGAVAVPSATSQTMSPPHIGPTPTQPATQSAARNPASQSQTSKGAPTYSAEHSEVSRTVLAEYLRTGKIPDPKQMRDDIRSAIEQGGLPKVLDRTLLDKAKETEGLVRALRGFPPEGQKSVLDEVLGKGRYLAAPAAGATAAVADQEQRDALARVLRGF